MPAARHPPCLTSLLFLSAVHYALAAPLEASSRRFVRRDSSSSNIVRIVVPIVVVVGIVIISLFVRFRKATGRTVGRFFNNTVHTPAASNSPRELTAAEMTGGTTTAAAGTRRPRRNRRTPSQMSTRSLPAYAKEPGELELVIIQGSPELEDTPAPATIVMPSLAERDSDSASSRHHARGRSEASSYVQVENENEPHVSTPLLSEEENDNDDEPSHANRNASAAEPSADVTDDSRAALLAGMSPSIPSGPDPRGEAPPYFEVVDSPSGLSRIDTRDTLPIAPSQTRLSEDAQPSPAPEPSPSAQEPARRRSVFRGIMHAFNPRARHDDAQHARSPSDTPTIPEGLPASPDAPRQSSRFSLRPVSGHRASQSAGSNSVFSIGSSGFHRAASRASNVPAGALTSPSAISVNSISAPLTHTATRTEMIYPRAGPTPDQLRLISSRENLGKFGVPYGPDALAFHASTSLVNLHGPPPEFEERPSIDGLPSSSPRSSPVPRTGSPVFRGSPGPSHLRTRSALSQTHSIESSGGSLPHAEEREAEVDVIPPALSRAPSQRAHASAVNSQETSTSPDTTLALSPETSLASDAPTITPDTSMDSTIGFNGKENEVEEEGVSELGERHQRDRTITRASMATIRDVDMNTVNPVTRASTRASTITIRPANKDAAPAKMYHTVSSSSSSSSSTATTKHTPAPISVPPPNLPLPSASTPNSAAATTPASAKPLASKRSNPGISSAPTAFKMPAPGGPARPASRASSITSVATFATAETSFSDARANSPGEETETEGELEMVSAPGTPRVE